MIRELQNSTQTDCWNGKAYTPTDQLTPGRTKYGANNNVRIFRYADVLLMNAEAKVRLGKDGDAPLKLVRDRAKMSEIDNATVDQILDERRMELVCEWGERYNDLIRTGKAASVLGSKGWTEDKTYYPLPFDQVSNIPSLTNEPIKLGNDRNSKKDITKFWDSVLCLGRERTTTGRFYKSSKRTGK